MTFEEMMAEAKRVGAQLILGQGGVLYSIDPPETLFGFSYHAHCIPPYRPEHTLILGYGGGTVAALMRMIWGSAIKITGVDKAKYDHKYVEYKMILGDAWQYMKSSTEGIFKKKFDYICVDLWNGDSVPDILFTPEFVVRAQEMTKRMICINVRREDLTRLQRNMLDYGQFKFERGDLVGENVVMWWSLLPTK